MCRNSRAFSLALLALLPLPAGARGGLSRDRDKNRVLLTGQANQFSFDDARQRRGEREAQ